MQLPAGRRAVARFRALLGASVGALAIVLAVGLHRTDVPVDLVWTDLASFALFGLALVGLAGSDVPVRRALLGVVVVAGALQLIGLSAAPGSSDDVYRYGWDAKVQLSGTDPYRFAPADPALLRLRTPVLFRSGPVGPHNAGCTWTFPTTFPTAVPTTSPATTPLPTARTQCTRINRPTVHTIYPPVAEAAFTLSRLVSFGRTDGPKPMQVFGGLGVLGLTLLLAQQALRRRRAPWTVAVWAWCPVVVIEVGNNAHIDWLAALLSVAALVALVDRRPHWAGLLIGAAVATKLYPGVLLASMLRRRPGVVLGFATGLVALSYVPHVLAVGGKVLGYLPGYLKEENYVSGGRFELLDLVLPEPLLAPAAAALLLAVAIWALRRSDPDRPEQTAVVVMGVVLLVTTPSYPWYALVLLALVAMSRRLEWLPLVLAMSVAQSAVPHLGVHGTGFSVGCYLLGALVPVLVPGVRAAANRLRTPLPA